MKVISKQAIIEALKNGGKVTENTVYQERRVYNAEGECIGACRWDTLWKLHKAGEIVKHSGGWSMTDTYTAARTYAEEQAAEAAETVARLEAGETAEDIGGGAFGLPACIESVMFYRDALHMDAAAILSHIEEAERKTGAFFNRTMWKAFDALFPGYREALAESARVEAATREALASAGMLAEEAPAEAAPATVCVECYETGERLEGPARAVYGALRWAARRDRHYGERGQAWHPACAHGDPRFAETWRIIWAAEDLSGPAAAPEGIRAEYIGAATLGDELVCEYWRFRGHVFREDENCRIYPAPGFTRGTR